MIVMDSCIHLIAYVDIWRVRDGAYSEGTRKPGVSKKMENFDMKLCFSS